VGPDRSRGQGGEGRVKKKKLVLGNFPKALGSNNCCSGSRGVGEWFGVEGVTRTLLKRREKNFNAAIKGNELQEGAHWVGRREKKK